MNSLENLWPRILIIGHIWPEPQSSAAGLRSWNLINTFLKAQWEVNFASPSAESSHSVKIEQAGVSVFKIQANDKIFDRFIQDLRPDFVIFDQFMMEEQFGWRVEEQCPEAVRILDTQDLHFLRKGRQLAIQSGMTLVDAKNCNFNLVSDVMLREVSSILRCDSTLIVSDFEIQLVTEELKLDPSLFLLSRFHYPSPEDCPGFTERRDFAMIGNFRHSPNMDGMIWFRREIWPLIRQGLPQAKVYIYGAYPSKSAMQLTHRDLGFHVVGPVLDQFKVLRQHRVNLAPLRYGAGIKGKITDGWWSGVPVVTTPVGAEGMYGNFSWGGEIGGDPGEFSKKAIAIYSDEILWNTHQKNGFEILRHLYSSHENSQALLRHLLLVKQRLDQVRGKNIMGAILRLNLNRSTKYFSKWIEAKNKVSAPESSRTLLQ